CGIPQHSILFVGYADPQSPGGILRSALSGDSVSLDPDEPPQTLRCHIEQFQFSAHASRESLIAYAAKVGPKKILLVHGDPPAADWLAQEEPDVVCLQETKCSDDQFPELALAAAGYRCVFHGQKSYNGVAILSRHKLHERQAALCDESEDPQARVIAATIKDVRVF